MTVHLPIVTRRDMLGADCLACETGVYSEGTYPESVVCRKCGHKADRWLTKREMLKLRCIADNDTYKTDPAGPSR